jgi:hypothetical protein
MPGQNAGRPSLVFWNQGGIPFLLTARSNAFASKRYAVALPTRSSLKIGALLLGCFLLMGSHNSPKRQAAPLDDVSFSYTRIAVALGERDPDSIDYYYGPAEWVKDIRENPPSLIQIRRSALALIAELRDKPVTPPGGEVQRQFLIGQLRAIASRVDLLLGAHLTFDQETEAMFGVQVPPRYDQRRLAHIRSRIDALLPGPGGLAERYSSFDQRFIVPHDRLPAVMDRALQGCREQTLAHMDLPPGEAVTVEYVHGKPWSAFSRYQGNFHSLIQINADFGLTVDQVLQLACHEGYPGHHAYNSLRELQLVREHHLTEFMVQPTFSPQSLASEAAATFAIELAFPEPERTRFERDELFPLAGLDTRKAELYGRVERLVEALHPAEPVIARDYLDGNLEFVRAAWALEAQVLMVHSDATLKYINEYRSYLTAYTLGRDMVADAVDDQPGRPAAARWQRFEQEIEITAPLPAARHEAEEALFLSQVPGHSKQELLIRR